MNKYLEKIASVKGLAEGAKEFGKEFKKGWRHSSTTSKIGLGMSATGLGLGTANYRNGIENKKNNKQAGDIEQKSLEELQTISRHLQAQTVTGSKL